MKVHVSAKNIIALGAFANQINALETARHALCTAQSILINIIALTGTSETKMHNFRPFSAGAGS